MGSPGRNAPTLVMYAFMAVSIGESEEAHYRGTPRLRAQGARWGSFPIPEPPVGGQSRSDVWWGSAFVMTTLIVTSATGLTAIFLLPQIVRLFRSGDASGLSGTWAAFGIITNLAWVVYLARFGLWSAVTAPSLAVVTYLVMLITLARRTRGGGWIWASAVYATSLAAIGASGGIETVGLLLILAPVVQLTPGVAAAYRERCPTGISPATWSLSATEAFLWGWYGWLVGDIALLGYGLVTGIGSMLILGRWLATGPKFRIAASGNA